VIRATFAVPGDLGSPTGGYAYDRALIAAGPGAGLTLDHLALPGGFPFPSDAALAETARLMAAAPADRPLLVDGLALGAMPDAVAAAARAPLAAMLHHPLALEAGLSAAEADALRASETAALARVRAVIVTSAATAATVSAMFDVDPATITVARPGLDRAPRARGSGGVPRILSVGSLIPRKGHDVLVDALARIADRAWTAEIVGSPAYAPGWAASVRARVRGAGLAGRVRFVGATSAAAVAEAYDRADLFCLPSRYEGYGMVFAEAMARGLPIVAARIAATEELVPEAAGALVPVDDAAALAGALAGLLDDAALRRRAGDAARAHAETLPDWPETARLARDALAKVIP
jgi:glycosyltransferase involved in cell wall biosynthesis